MKVGDYDMPDDLLYSKEYAWVRREGDFLRIGVIDFAVKLAGKIEYVDLPLKGQHFEKDDIFGTVESGKWVGEMLMPVSAEVVDTNVPLLDAPSLVHDDPYGEGWLILVRPDSMDDLTQLMSEREEIRQWLEAEIRAVEKDKK
ncbi:MAG: glycine cleavage system protein H [Candidatus Methanofastidiosia archaeon]